MSDESDDILAECSCGSSWFRLCPHDGDAPFMNAGALAFTESGHVTSWSGLVVCLECWEPYDFGADLTPAPIIQLHRKGTS